MLNYEKTVVAANKFRTVAKNKINALSVTVYSTVLWFELEWFYYNYRSFYSYLFLCSDQSSSLNRYKNVGRFRVPGSGKLMIPRISFHGITFYLLSIQIYECKKKVIRKGFVSELDMFRILNTTRIFIFTILKLFRARPIFGFSKKTYKMYISSIFKQHFVKY